MMERREFLQSCTGGLALAILPFNTSKETDVDVYNRLVSKSPTIVDLNDALSAWSRGERFEYLYVKLAERGPYNFIVTSPEIANLFSSATAGFSPAYHSPQRKPTTIEYVGVINCRWRLYRHNLLKNNELLLGHNHFNTAIPFYGENASQVNCETLLIKNA